MSWGHIVSKDMLNWTKAANTIALFPDHEYDRDGVFTGCWVPNKTPDDRKLKVIYSSVRKLPFHWSTPPYPRNAAGLAMAMSKDGGASWEKFCGNPFLSGEPDGLEVTGFRDPYLSEWPSMDLAMRKSTPSLYGLVSGGIEGEGPATFLYEVSPEAPTIWKWLGSLVSMPARFQPSHHWSGNYGLNWECVNFMTLNSGGRSREVLIVGAEGDVEKAHVRKHALPDGLPPRTVRAQLWMSGQLVQSSGVGHLEYSIGGYLDHGTYYAANSFVDPKTGRRIVYGWIPEEDVSADFARQKGWNGALAIPREIFLLQIPSVRKALGSQLDHLSGFEKRLEQDGSVTLTTLGIRPISEVDGMRNSCQSKLRTDLNIEMRDRNLCPEVPFCTTSTSSWDLEAIVDIHPGCKEFGLLIHHADGCDARTRVIFSLDDESIAVDRSLTNSFDVCNRCPERGPFTLFTKRDMTDDRHSEGVLEKLRLRVIADGDVLEIFANDRFALATMIYREGRGIPQDRLMAFANGESGSSVVGSVSVWDGVGTV